MERLLLELGKTCGHCEFCKTGRYNLCPDVIFFATPPVGGTFQEYVAHETDICFKLPDNISTMESALIEPLAVGFYAAKQGNAHAGQSSVVLGAGCIGLVTLLALKTMGLTEVYVVDIMQNRLDKALELGATAAGAITTIRSGAIVALPQLNEVENMIWYYLYLWVLNRITSLCSSI